MKKALSRLSEAYKRRRHSMGFGVHSPFCYSFVKNVVRPGREMYYGYHDIEREPDATAGERREARLLLRLAVSLDVRSVYSTERLPEVFNVALRAAYSKMEFADVPEKAMLIISCDGVPDVDSLRSLLSKPGRIVLVGEISEYEGRSLLDSMPGGVWFRGKRRSIFVARDFMAKVIYTVNI